MKKILTVLCASALMMAMPATNVFAEDQEKTQTDTSANITLTATKASSYTVKLPTTYDVSSDSTTIDVQVKGDVDSAKKVTIGEQENAENKLADKADTNNKVSISVSFGDPVEGGDIATDYSTNAKTTITITHGALSAGSYEYELPITISLT